MGVLQEDAGIGSSDKQPPLISENRPPAVPSGEDMCLRSAQHGTLLQDDLVR